VWKLRGVRKKIEKDEHCIKLQRISKIFIEMFGY